MEEALQKLFSEGRLAEAERYLDEWQDDNAKTIILKILFRVFHMELACGEEKTVFDYSVQTDELVKHYIKVKLLLRRLEFDLPKEHQQELRSYCRQCFVSKDFLTVIVLTNIFDQAGVCRRLIRIFASGDEKDRQMAEYFRSLLLHIRQQGKE